ncbi:ABC transporter permease [Paraneptunicella aestuarii]|uniref:ABC transporter permease n=1 Tax=Paraneptunicella aestuarii TaxID=2831148 RepID=UPI001E3CAA0E|nr:ABC transporter permease [Paraneptunicella aestuarii]UAA40579.1 ABC transporter permease [Paraneptunicella aestuarii]
MLVQIAVSSLLARKFTVLLTVISISVSFFVLLGIDHMKTEMRQSFGRTVSGVDIIAGGRTSSVNLLLYSVFRIGNATNNISWQSYEELSKGRGVAWSIPVSLGDSHRGYRVLGTNNSYFEHYQYGNKQPLAFNSGQFFERVYDVVLGAGVAKTLGYSMGQSLTIAHGVGSTSFTQHEGHPFKITGILKPTGTPIDQTIHVTLAAINAIHESMGQHSHLTRRSSIKSEPDDHAHAHSENEHDEHDHNHQQSSTSASQASSPANPLIADITTHPESITAVMLGLTSKIATLGYLRTINEYKGEPLSAIMPGLALQELWQMMNMVENTLTLIAYLVLLAALFGMMTMLLASMRERQREIAILRAAGASALFVLVLIEAESMLIVILGMLLGFIALVGVLSLYQALLAEEFGLFVSAVPDLASSLGYALLVLLLSVILSFIPAWMSYRQSMINGLTVNY